MSEGDDLSRDQHLRNGHHNGTTLELEIPSTSSPSPPPAREATVATPSSSPSPDDPIAPPSPIPDLPTSTQTTSPRRKSTDEAKFANQSERSHLLFFPTHFFSGRKSFVYEQISDKNKTSLLKSQFTKKATVKVTTSSVPHPPSPPYSSLSVFPPFPRCECVVEQGKTVRINEYYFLKTLGKVSMHFPPPPHTHSPSPLSMLGSLWRS
jgi:hypothetical protein